MSVGVETQNNLSIISVIIVTHRTEPSVEFARYDFIEYNSHAVIIVDSLKHQSDLIFKTLEFFFIIRKALKIYQIHEPR